MAFFYLGVADIIDLKGFIIHPYDPTVVIYYLIMAMLYGCPYHIALLISTIHHSVSKLVP